MWDNHEWLRLIETKIVPALTSMKTSSDNLDKLLGNINNNLTAFMTNFKDFSDITKKFQSTIKQYFENANSFLMQIRDILKNIEKFYYPNSGEVYPGISKEDVYDIKSGWHSFWSTFRYKKFDDVLLEVNQKIEDKVNPLSENNSAAFEGAITNIKDNTFIGSANEMVTTFPEELKGALNKDSSPVLQFTTAGVSNGYFSLPAKKYSIDFSWYAPFKGTADTVISAFMYLGFLIAFWKRLPEIIHGAGVMYVGQAEFHESQFNDRVSDIMANDYYEQLVSHDGYDDLDMADGEYDSYGNYSSYERDWW